MNRMATTSQARQNFHADCEAAINKQINLELYSSYVYLSMATFFNRDDVALPGFHKYFKKNSLEEREHAQRFIDYQNTRGGRVVFMDIQKPPRDEWGTPLEAMEEALKLEKEVNASLLNRHRISTDRNDPQLCDFLETHYLQEQIDAIKEISDHITQLKRVGPGLGEYMYDRESMNDDD